jgi:hypothetical protein
VTTLNGQEAQFLSGGSFPIPVPGKVWWLVPLDFGVKLSSSRYTGERPHQPEAQYQREPARDHELAGGHADHFLERVCGARPE